MYRYGSFQRLRNYMETFFEKKKKSALIFSPNPVRYISLPVSLLGKDFGSNLQLRTNRLRINYGKNLDNLFERNFTIESFMYAVGRKLKIYQPKLHNELFFSHPASSRCFCSK